MSTTGGPEMSDTDPNSPAEPQRELPPLIWPTEPPAAPHPPRPDAPPRRPRRRIVAAILAAAVLLASGVGIGWGLTRNNGSTGLSLAPRAPAGSEVAGSNVRAIAAKVDPAVVDVNTFLNTAALGRPGQGAGGRPLGAGTGMVLNSSGEVLTNNHVV